MLAELDNPSSGHVIHSLSDISLHRVFVTPHGNQVVRNEFEILIGDHTLILPKLLPGEEEILRIPDVEVKIMKNEYSGSVVLTQFQLLFFNRSFKKYNQLTLAPFGTVARLEKLKVGFSKLRKIMVYRKDMNPDIQVIMDKSIAKSFLKTMTNLIFPFSMRSLFCFIHQSTNSLNQPVQMELVASKLRSNIHLNINGWHLYDDPLLEFKRMEVNWDQWRVSNVNRNYTLCKSYSEVLVVPKDISNEQLVRISQFRTQNRVSILSYYHKTSQATITRCSQPKTGVNSRSSEDELMLESIRIAGINIDKPLVIIDPRPKLNATANRAVGAGYEKKEYYVNTIVEFMGIDNIHCVRDSFMQLKSMCLSTDPKIDNSWHSNLESTGWLKHIKHILKAVEKVVNYIDKDETSCLVHCSDGWDRTSQIVSLAMLCLDPFYRTLTGFAVLIEKEWKSAGHMFKSRIGHAIKNHGDENRSPIFLQWVECVWQLTRQYPTSFEFNETFLIRLIDESYNCRFGTFLTDNDEQAKGLDVKEDTISFWSYVHQPKHFPKFLNHFYMEPIGDESVIHRSPVVLTPCGSLSILQFWSKFYLRIHPKHDCSFDIFNSIVKEQSLAIKALRETIDRFMLASNDQSLHESNVIKDLSYLSSQPLGLECISPDSVDEHTNPISIGKRAYESPAKAIIGGPKTDSFITSYSQSKSYTTELHIPFKLNIEDEVEVEDFILIESQEKPRTKLETEEVFGGVLLNFD